MFGMNKIGIMGGTFNPIHNGHLILAEEAYEQLGLDLILFMPTKTPPHKDKASVLSEEHRVKMVSLAIHNNDHFELSYMELERKGITYTADTLTLLRDENPQIEYYFIIGADSLFAMMEWHKPERIFELCTLIVANRDDNDPMKLEEKAEEYRQGYGAKIKQILMPKIDIASGSLRQWVRNGKSIRYYVPDSVLEYIIEHHLYD